MEFLKSNHLGFTFLNRLNRKYTVHSCWRNSIIPIGMVAYQPGGSSSYDKFNEYSKPTKTFLETKSLTGQASSNQILAPANQNTKL